MRLPDHLAKSTAATKEQRTLYAEHVRQLYSTALVGLLSSAVNSLVLVVIQRDVTSRAALIAWVASLSVISLVRYRDIRAFWRRSPEVSDPRHWGRRFIVGLALSGLAWGSSALFLFPIDSLAHQTFLAFVLGGMVAGAAAAFSSLMKAFLAYSVPALCPIIVRFALIGDEFHLAMGGMALLFGVIMFSVAKRINGVRTTSVMLRFENSGLLSHVEERTEELRRAYDNLKKETEERQEVESRLRRAQKMEALGTLAGGIAHDFNNILAAIIGFSEMAIDRMPEKSPARRSMERVFTAALRGRDLVRQLLTFSRQTEQEKKPLQLNNIVKETANLLRATTPTTISIRVNTQSESGPILGDPIQIQQILMNLCTNAVYAMREKGGALDIDLSDFSVSPSDENPHGIKPGPYVRLEVRDTGIGISSAIIDNIFDPFFTTKKTGEGTGLGLSVVHGIVKQHDGHITVDSEPGKGSTFTVYLPRIAEGQRAGSAGEEVIPTGSEHILFIDDEEALVEMGEGMLAELGYDVTSRMSSSEALALFRLDPSRFDLVITDQTMPELTGIELARGIMAIRVDIPIILCTGFSHLVDADKAKAAGIRAFTMKPLTKREIAMTIRQVLDDQARFKLFSGNR